MTQCRQDQGRRGNVFLTMSVLILTVTGCGCSLDHLQQADKSSVADERRSDDTSEKLFKLIPQRRFWEARTLIKQEHALLQARNARGQTALLVATEMRPPDVPFIEFLLEAGVDVNAQDQLGTTALMEAARSGETPTVELLLRHGPQLELRDRAGNTALDYAVLFGHQAVGADLVSAGARHDAFQAAALGLKTEVERFLRDDPSLVNARDKQGYNMLQWAVQRKHPDIVRLLLMRKAGLDPFELAALGRTAELERHLENDPELAKRADPHTRLTALQWAVLGKAHASAELLLRIGADPNVDSQPPVPTSPLVLAIRQGDIEMVRLLLRYGADSKRFYPGLGTPYTLAIAQKRMDIAALLKRK